MWCFYIHFGSQNAPKTKYNLLSFDFVKTHKTWTLSKHTNVRNSLSFDKVKTHKCIAKGGEPLLLCKMGTKFKHFPL